MRTVASATLARRISIRFREMTKKKQKFVDRYPFPRKEKEQEDEEDDDEEGDEEEDEKEGQEKVDHEQQEQQQEREEGREGQEEPDEGEREEQGQEEKEEEEEEEEEKIGAGNRTTNARTESLIRQRPHRYTRFPRIRLDIFFPKKKR